MRRHRADGNLAVGLPDVIQIRDAGQIDQDFRLREPKLHRRYETMAAGENFRIVVEQPHGFVESARPVIIECSGNHRMALHTFSGVSGKSRCRTPSASTTALAMAGVAPIVPASPTPLMPSGLLVEGVTVLPM